MRHIDPALVGVDEGLSELGQELAQLVADTPGAIGAVLTDEEDDPIDMAHIPEQVTELEIQLAGAQIGQTIVRLDAQTRAAGLGAATVLVECSRGALCTTRLNADVILTMQLQPGSGFGRAFREFDDAADRLKTML